MTRIAAIATVISVLAAGLAVAQMGPAQQGPGMPQMQEAPELDLEDGELEQFAEALVDVQFIQQDAQTEVQGVIEDSDLSIERFQEIYQGTTMGAQPGGEEQDIDISDDEQAAYDQALETIEEIEMGAAEDMEQAVSDRELSVDRFNTLAQGIPQNPDLAQELNEIAQQIMEERGEF
ncbi:MAG: DUF4168 domain-containing protein [Spirochaetales bacterium]